MSAPEIKQFNWCGATWQTCMESGRPIHPDKPWYYINGSQVIQTHNNTVQLFMKYNPTTLEWGWEEKVEYNPKIACGLIKSVQAFPVNSKFECEVKFPEGKNLWFSFWLTACDSWPPEIDIFEGYTDENSSFFDKLGLHLKFPFIFRNVRAESNVHYKDLKSVHRQIGPKGVHKSFFNTKDIKNLPNSWEKFTCIWKKDVIEFFINGKLARRVKDKKVLRRMETQGMWVIFNVWPNDVFNTSETGDIISFCNPFEIRNFKHSLL